MKAMGAIDERTVTNFYNALNCSHNVGSIDVSDHIAASEAAITRQIEELFGSTTLTNEDFLRQM
jgi:hypothetical protein